jgi:hypothetical protein
MTAERPMFPPRAGECRVIQFSQFAAAAKLSKEDSPQDNALTRFREERVARREAKLLELTTAPETLTTTCKNQRMRLSRRDAWWAAERLTRYWRARLDWWSALSLAQTYNVADANSYPKCHEDGLSDDRLSLVDLWRTALMKQMLTPAPDMAAVNWKRVQLRGGVHRHTAVKPEKLERAIEADVQWLNDHPMRAKKDS